MYETYFPLEVREYFSNLRMHFLQSGIFHFVVSLELLDDELGVGPKLDMRSSERYGSFDTQKGTRIFRDVVRRFSEVLVPAFDGGEVRSTDIYTQSRRSRISPGSTVGIHDEFFHTANGGLSDNFAPKIFEFAFQCRNFR